MSNWEQYFYDLCMAVSENSKCLSRKLGSVIIKDEKYIISTGYNGPVTGSIHCDFPGYRGFILDLREKEIGSSIPERDKIIYENKSCIKSNLGFKPRSGEGLAYCQAAHAERNAIDVAARNGISVKGCRMYMNCGIPCIECSKSIVMSGISEIIVKEMVDYEKVGWRGRNILIAGVISIKKLNFKDR